LIFSELVSNGLFVNWDTTKKDDNNIAKDFNFSQICQKLKIINPNNNPFSDEDLSNSYSGYIPLSVKYIESILTENNLTSQIQDIGMNYDPFKKFSNVLVFVMAGISYGEV